MRSAVVGLVTIVVLVAASCTDDPTVDEQVATEPAEPTAEVVEEPVAEAAEQPAEVASEPPSEPVGDGLFPTVVDASASSSDGVSWRVDVTLSSEYDTPERYADAWRVLDADDNELGIRVLGHDHANEQPFTRSTNVEIPSDVDVVYIEGRDQVNGWSGERFELELNR